MSKDFSAFIIIVILIIVIIFFIIITNVSIAVQMEGERCQAEYMFGIIPAGSCDQGLHCVKQKNMALGAGKCVKSHPDVDLGLHPHHTERGQSGTSVSQSISQSVCQSVPWREAGDV